MDAAEAAGAIGRVQIDNNDAAPSVTALSAGIPGFENVFSARGLVERNITSDDLIAELDRLAATGVVVRITDGGILGNDVLTIRNATNTGQLPLGSVDLRRRDYVTATRDFRASGTPSQIIQTGNTITLTLGTPSGSTTAAARAASIIWTPSASATDRAGNGCSTTPSTESGTSDLDF